MSKYTGLELILDIRKRRKNSSVPCYKRVACCSKTWTTVFVLAPLLITTTVVSHHLLSIVLTRPMSKAFFPNRSLDRASLAQQTMLEADCFSSFFCKSCPIYSANFYSCSKNLNTLTVDLKRPRLIFKLLLLLDSRSFLSICYTADSSSLSVAWSHNWS